MFALRKTDAPQSHADPAVALASGFLGTLAMTTIMYVVPALGIGQVDLPLWVARLFVHHAAQAAALHRQPGLRAAYRSPRRSVTTTRSNSR